MQQRIKPYRFLEDYGSTTSKSKNKDIIVLNQEYFEKALTPNANTTENTNFSDEEETKEDNSPVKIKAQIKGLENALKESQKNEEEEKQVNKLTFRKEDLDVIAEDA